MTEQQEKFEELRKTTFQEKRHLNDEVAHLNNMLREKEKQVEEERKVFLFSMSSVWDVLCLLLRWCEYTGSVGGCVSLHGGSASVFFLHVTLFDAAMTDE